jgi:hypothetical protein
MGEAFGCSYLYLKAIDAVRSTTKSALLPNPDFPDVRPLSGRKLTQTAAFARLESAAGLAEPA